MMYCPYCDREIDDRESRCDECGCEEFDVPANGGSTYLYLSFNPLAARHNNSNRLRVPTWLYLTTIGTLVTITFIAVVYACYRIGVLDL